MNINRYVCISYKVNDTFNISFRHDFRFEKIGYLTNFYYHNQYDNIYSIDNNDYKELEKRFLQEAELRVKKEKEKLKLNKIYQF